MHQRPTNVFEWRGARMLDAKFWRKQCFTCMWANKSAVEIECKFSKVKRYRKEIFCYALGHVPCTRWGLPDKFRILTNSRRLMRAGWMTCARNDAAKLIAYG